MPLACRVCETPLEASFFKQDTCSFWYGERNEDIDKIISKTNSGVEIRLCRRCGVIQLDASDELLSLLKALYSSSSSSPGATHGQNTAYSKKLTSDFFKSYDELTEGWVPETVLEVGCQSGRLLYDFEKRGAQCCVGVEPADILPFEREDGSWVDVRREFFSPEIFTERFDFVYCLQVLEHIERPMKFLRMMHEVLHLNGKVLIGVPNEELALQNGNIGMVIHQHINYFTRDSLSHMLALAGFKVTGLLHKQEQPLYVLAEKTIKSQHQPFLGKNEELEKAAARYASSVTDHLEFIQDVVNRSSGRVGLYGANCAMANVFSWCPNLDLDKIMVFDGDPLKQGKLYSGIPLVIHSPDDLDQVGDIVVVPYRLQEVIADYLVAVTNVQARIHRLYQAIL